jgi:uncharacterized protein (TIGR01777 family)
MQKILLSGGSGLIGTHLTSYLKSVGYDTAVLTRAKSDPERGFYHWDPASGVIDQNALNACSSIIHLAGAGIADKVWTPKRKREILESRIESTQLLFESLKRGSHRISTLISASAIGIYGDGGDELKTEESKIDRGFLQDTCLQWEKQAERFTDLGIRLVILRIGVVLTNKGSALPQMSLPVKLFLGAPLGTGRQYISWIHIDDLCRIFQHAIEIDSMKGVYNAVASEPKTNKQFYRSMAKELNRPLWPVHVPTFVLKLILGEKSEIVLSGQKVSNEKLLETDFKFAYKNCEEALASLL